MTRLRLSGAHDTDVRFSCGTLGDGSAGLWDAQMSIGWPDGRVQQTESNRIRLGDGTVIDCDEMDVSFRGEVQTEPTRAPGESPTSIDSHFVRRWLAVNANDGDWCWEHDPGGAAFATATYTNVAPPFSWYVNNRLAPSATGDTLDESSFRSCWDGRTPVEVRCEWTGNAGHQSILVIAWNTVYLMGHCPPSATNIVGAAWTSTHNPTNATNHLPETYPESITQYGPNCPLATNLTIKAGWTHNTACLLIRNLVRILTGDPWDDETDHCVGLIWSEGGSISLYDYLADCCKPYADKFTYAVNGRPCGGTLEFGAEPDKYHPTVFHVELRDEDGGKVLDRMWIVVNAPQTKKDFDKWYGKNVATSWVNTLPKPYAKLQISSSWLWGESATPVNLSNPDPWDSPSKLSGYLHHDSAWEMRSQSVGTHGNQACYDANGDIVLNGIGGGTADKFYAGGWTVPNHVGEDVNPFLNALHLDGNPGDTGWFNDISRPCLYQGDNLDKYIERRPIIHPEGE